MVRQKQRGEKSIGGTKRPRDTHPLPTREVLEHTSILREDLYRRCPPEGGAIPILVQPIIITDGYPEREDILVAVCKLRIGQAVIPSVMIAKHLKAWLRETTWGKDPDREHWYKLVSITRLAFWDKHTPEALECTMMVIIPNSGGGYRFIGLV